MSADRHRPGYIRRRVGRAVVSYLAALALAATVVTIWWLTR